MPGIILFALMVAIFWHRNARFDFVKYHFDKEIIYSTGVVTWLFKFQSRFGFLLGYFRMFEWKENSTFRKGFHAAC